LEFLFLSTPPRIAQGYLAAQLGTPLGNRLEQTIDDINDDDRGAFRSWTSDPVFSALAILFGGGGSLIAIEQLLPWMLI